MIGGGKVSCDWWRLVSRDWVQVVADLATSWRFLALGVLLSLLICLAWVWSMRWTAGCLVRHYIYIYTIYIYTISTLHLQYIYTVSTPYLHYIYTRAGWAEDLPSLGTGRAGHGCTSFITGQGDTVSRHV